MMNLNHLRYFTVVVKRGSLRRASEELNVSQPALSNSLKKLEATVDAPLLERSPQGVTPTEFGKALYHFATIAIDSVNRGTQEINLLRRGAKGHVTVGAPGGVIEQIMPSIVSQIRETYPGYTFSVQFGLLHDLLEQMADGRLDFLVTSFWAQSNLTDNLRVEPLADLSMSVYGRAGHALLSNDNLVFEDIARADWILLDSPTMKGFAKVILGTDRNRDISQPVFSNYIPFIFEMIKKVDLLSIFPDALVQDRVAKGDLVRFAYPVMDEKITIALICSDGRTHTPAMLKFAEAARQIVHERFDDDAD